MNKVMAQLLVREVQSDLNLPSHAALGEKYYSDWIGFGVIHLRDLPPGHYEIYVQYAWPVNSMAYRNEIK